MQKLVDYIKFACIFRNLKIRETIRRLYIINETQWTAMLNQLLSIFHFYREISPVCLLDILYISVRRIKGVCLFVN